jgi:tricorn protease
MNLYRSILTVLAAFATLLLFLAPLPATAQTWFLSHPAPSPDGRTVVFTYEGDLWQVPVEGGQATRLTGMTGEETHPRFSPDGNYIAFSGAQDGNSSVYLLPAGGGDLQRLTWHDGTNLVNSWSADSRLVRFSSDRYNYIDAYEVSVSGGTPRRLMSDHFFTLPHDVAQDPVTGRIYFNDTWESFRFYERKHYRGPFNPVLRSWNPATGEVADHTTHDGKNMWPSVDRNGVVYYTSDEYNGEYNLYRLGANGVPEQLTRFERSIRYPQVSFDGTVVVFEKDYQIWAYHTATGEASVVPVEVVRNQVLDRPVRFNVRDNITFFDVSPDRKKLAFVSRGALFVSDIEGRFVRQVPVTEAERVGEVIWLSDTELMYTRTDGGWYNVFRIAADTRGSERRVTEYAQHHRNLKASPNREQVAWFRGRNDVVIYESAGSAYRLLHQAELWSFRNNTLQWSPDGVWIAFNAHHFFERDILVVNTQSGDVKNLTGTGVTENTPFWSPDGRYIYFSTDRIQPSYPRGNTEANIYRMALAPVAPPLRSDRFDRLFEADTAKTDEAARTGSGSAGRSDRRGRSGSAGEATSPVIGSAGSSVVTSSVSGSAAGATSASTGSPSATSATTGTGNTTTVRIDTDGLHQRWEQITSQRGNQTGPYVIADGEKHIVIYGSGHDGSGPSLWKTVLEPFKSPETTKIEGARTWNTDIVTVDKHHYLLIGGNVHTLDIQRGRAERLTIEFDFTRRLMPEFQQIFHETWANIEENFYDESFHGRDWPALRDYYASFLPRLNSRASLRRLTNDMLGELNASHMGFTSTGDEENTYYESRTLATGILFRNDEPFVVERIVDGSAAWSQGHHNNLQPGDVLVTVNGQPVETQHNREQYFASPFAGQELIMGFQRGDIAVEIRVPAQSSASLRNLLYDEWMHSRKALVDAATDQSVAYIHMKNMGTGELEHFQRELARQLPHRRGLILDLRYNRGGNVHDDVINALSRRTYLNWQFRSGAVTGQPNFAPMDEPIVVLINEQSLSDAEMTAAGLQALGIGTVMGMPTYRWIIFTTGISLVDGSFHRLPAWGVYTLEGENLELTGVAPSIRVETTFNDLLNGRDPQLESAIRYVLENRSE